MTSTPRSRHSRRAATPPCEPRSRTPPRASTPTRRSSRSIRTSRPTRAATGATTWAATSCGRSRSTRRKPTGRPGTVLATLTNTLKDQVDAAKAAGLDWNYVGGVQDAVDQAGPVRARLLRRRPWRPRPEPLGAHVQGLVRPPGPALVLRARRARVQHRHDHRHVPPERGRPPGDRPAVRGGALAEGARARSGAPGGRRRRPRRGRRRSGHRRRRPGHRRRRPRHWRRRPRHGAGDPPNGDPTGVGGNLPPGIPIVGGTGGSPKKAGKCSTLKGKKRAKCVKKACGRYRGRSRKAKLKYRACVKVVTRKAVTQKG